MLGSVEQQQSPDRERCQRTGKRRAYVAPGTCDKNAFASKRVQPFVIRSVRGFLEEAVPRLAGGS